LRTVNELPRPVREIENLFIPLSDGTRLAARIWLPEDAEHDPVPGVLEYIPYRKRDGTAIRDSMSQPYVAGHGYACIRVDLRGSGESDGVLQDEYLQQELDDGVEVLRWIAEQPWCTGRVGIKGKSWGGVNGLQIAAMRPPELGAVITVCSTDDRYADDIHFMGGCLLGDNLSWASEMLAECCAPPDPRLVGERWRDLWMGRLRGSGLWVRNWLGHQRRDDFWKHGSVCEDWDAIQVPVMAVSGWADGYSNSVLRLLRNLRVPRKGLIGPWGHKYPHLGVPGPAIHFLAEEIRWWDQWLKDEDSGVMNGPMLRAWMQESVPPTTHYETRPGRWVGERVWPSPHIEERRLVIGPGLLTEVDEGVPELPLTIQSPLSVGLFAGRWASFTATPDLPHDQREEDGGALTFESAPLSAPIEILGAPVVELDIAASRPVAMIAARLSDVAPDDRATRITYGLLNLTHRDSHEMPEPLEPGRRYRVTVRLNEVAQSFPEGHRLRLSISTSYWPVAWPPPEPVRLSIQTRVSSLVLPVREPRPEDAQLARFGEPEMTAPLTTTLLEPRRYAWNVHRDLARDVSTLEIVKNEGSHRFDATDLEVSTCTTEYYTYEANDFDSLRGETRTLRAWRRGDWSVRTEARTVLTADASAFRIVAELDAYEDDRRVFCESWDERIPRDLL